MNKNRKDVDAIDSFALPSSLRPGEHERGLGPVISEEGVLQVFQPRDAEQRVLGRKVDRSEIREITRVIGIGVADNPIKLAAVVAAMDAVREQSGRLGETYIQVGREMLALRRALSREENDKALRGAQALFPGWTSGNLSKVMAAAEFWDRNWVDHQLLPTGYTVLYYLSKLEKRDVDRAVQRHLISPSITKVQAEHLKSRLNEPEDLPPEPPRVGPQVELKKLRRRMSVLRNELSRAERHEAELVAAVGSSVPRGTKEPAREPLKV